MHLLPQCLQVRDFLLQGTRDAPNQRKLLDFQQHAPTAVAAAELYPNLRPHDDVQATEQHQRKDGQVMVQNRQQHGEEISESHVQQQQQQAARGKQVAQLQQEHELQQHAQEPGDMQHQTQPTVPTSSAVLTTSPARAHRSGSPAKGPAASGVPANNDSAQKAAAELRAACDVLKGRPRSTAEDPEGFMTSFFKSSRLHFIGTWKARIEALMLADEGTGRSPAPAAAAAGGPLGAGGFFGPAGRAAKAGGAKGLGSRTIIHLDMDAFFATVAELGRDEFKGRLQ